MLWEEGGPDDVGLAHNLLQEFEEGAFGEDDTGSVPVHHT